MKLSVFANINQKLCVVAMNYIVTAKKKKQKDFKFCGKEPAELTVILYTAARPYWVLKC